MAAGLRAVVEAADLIDLVLEVRDARLPRSTHVADLHRRLRSKPALVLLNRKDLADPATTHAWLVQLSNRATAFAGNGTSAATLRPLRAAITSFKGRRTRTRVAVVGAPNTGKSSVINALVHRKRALVQDKAGVTRHVRWIALDDKVDILDTPGVLAPRVTSQTVAWQLAACGILPESAFDAEDVVERLSAWLGRSATHSSGALEVETFARERGMLRRGGEIDRRSAARAYLKEFRAGHLGRVTFELAEERN
jgi:ribosome biogenesis GTPase A